MQSQSNAAAATQPAAQQTAQQATPPETFLGQIAFNSLLTQALYVAAKLDIADLLAEGQQSSTELAAKTGTHERALYRIMRSLASAGVFTEVEPKVFALTPNAEPLRSHVPNSLRDMVIFWGASWHWNVWGNMLYSVETGKPAWGKTHSLEVFDYFASNPEASAIFNHAMSSMSQSHAPAIVEAYDFSRFHSLADLGGGHGFLLSQILKANPKLKGVLFDLPHVVAGADALIEREGVAERVEKVAGDFFGTLPSADAYIMKHIIHDWDDETSVRILKNIRTAIKTDGRLLLAEMVVPAGDEPHFSKILDLEMLTSPGGVERTAEEFRELLAAAGFRLSRIVATRSPLSIIEAVGA